MSSRAPAKQESLTVMTVAELAVGLAMGGIVTELDARCFVRRGAICEARDASWPGPGRKILLVSPQELAVEWQRKPA